MHIHDVTAYYLVTRSAQRLFSAFEFGISGERDKKRKQTNKGQPMWTMEKTEIKCHIAHNELSVNCILCQPASNEFGCDLLQCFFCCLLYGLSSYHHVFFRLILMLRYNISSFRELLFLYYTTCIYVCPCPQYIELIVNVNTSRNCLLDDERRKEKKLRVNVST